MADTCFEQDKITCPGGGCADSYRECTNAADDYSFDLANPEEGWFFDDPETTWDPNVEGDFEGKYREDLISIFDQIGGTDWTGLEYKDWIENYALPPSWEGSSYQDQAELILEALGLLPEERSLIDTIYDDKMAGFVLEESGLDLKETLLEDNLSIDMEDFTDREEDVGLLQDAALEEEELLAGDLEAIGIKETQFAGDIEDIGLQRVAGQNILNTKRITSAGKVAANTLDTEKMRRRGAGIGVGRTQVLLDELYGSIAQQYARDVLAKNIDEDRFGVALKDIGTSGTLDAAGDVLTQGTGSLGLLTLDRAAVADKQDLVDLREEGYLLDLADIERDRDLYKGDYIYEMGGYFDAVTGDWVDDSTKGAIDLQRDQIDLDEEILTESYGKDILGLETRRIGYESDIEGIESAFENNMWDYIFNQMELLQCPGWTRDGGCPDTDGDGDGDGDGDCPEGYDACGVCGGQVTDPADCEDLTDLDYDTEYDTEYDTDPDTYDTATDVDCEVDPDHPDCTGVLDDDDYGTVEDDDAGTVEDDAGTIEDDAGTVEDDAGTIEDDAGTIEDDEYDTDPDPEYDTEEFDYDTEEFDLIDEETSDPYIEPTPGDYDTPGQDYDSPGQDYDTPGDDGGTPGDDGQDEYQDEDYEDPTGEFDDPYDYEDPDYDEGDLIDDELEDEIDWDQMWDDLFEEEEIEEEEDEEYDEDQPITDEGGDTFWGT